MSAERQTRTAAGGNIMPDESQDRKLSLRINPAGDKIVVHCSGRLVAGVTELLYSEVKEMIAAGKPIVLDLTGLTQMDSLGLGTIVRLYVSATSAGCSLRLINLAPRIREVLSVTNLLNVFELLGDPRKS
jgi:anti-sigma B factor antagonist